MIEYGLQRTAEEFWKEAGGPAPFPRDLEDAVMWALPLAVLKVPRLWVHDVRALLRERRIPSCLPAPDRPLRGCLVAHQGKGCVLMDGTDPPDERRFTLAHEAAHFMLDYLEPRRRAVARLGAGIVDVVDGRRAPRVDERIDAVLTGTPIGVHTHLMDRRADGVIGCAGIAGVEDRADRLALELLAPAAEVERRLAGAGRLPRFADAVARATAMLRDELGLPPAVAGPYARALYRERYGGPSFREWVDG